MSSLVALTLATTMMTLPVDCMDKIGKVLHSNDFFKFMCVNKSAARSLKIQAQQRRHSWAQALYLLSFIKAFVEHQGFVLLEDILEIIPLKGSQGWPSIIRYCTLKETKSTWALRCCMLKKTKST